jgi:hypothetical protein
LTCGIFGTQLYYCSTAVYTDALVPGYRSESPPILKLR